MNLAAAAPAPRPATAAFTERLAAARDQLAYVSSDLLDTPLRVDTALANLHGASASIHQALAGAGALPAELPGGVTSFPRTALALLEQATQEVGRAVTGSPVDAPLVDDAVSGAKGRLQQAIRLVAHPPSTRVHDGS